MRPTRLRLRVLLVLCLVLVPGVLSLVTWRLMRQERELEVARLGERRALLVAQLAQQMLLLLERERQREGAAGGEEATFGTAEGSFLLSAPLTSEGLSLPWDAAGGTRSVGTAVEALIRSAEALEFREDRPDLAASRYAEAADAADSPAARAGAKLREARARARAGGGSEAIEAYRSVAETSPTVVDDEGMPYALYGAEGLMGAERPDLGYVLRRLESVAASHGITGVEGESVSHGMASARTLAPSALYALRDLARRTADLIPDVASPGGTSELSDRARSLEANLTSEIDMVERLLLLRRDVTALLAMGRSAQGSSGPGRVPAGSTPLAAAWMPYGPVPWLIGVSEGSEGMRVLVADPERVLAALAAEDGGFASVLPHVRLTTVPAADAELLGPSFPGLFAVLPDEAVPPAGGSDFGRLLLFVVLPLVLAVTAVAALLVWRDVQREIVTAGLRAQFVSSVSHELKTPLTSIRMFAETLLLGRRPEGADQEEYLATIVNESERLTRLIDNVLDFSRIDRGERVYQMSQAPLGEVVRDAARAMSYPLQQGDFDLRVTTPDASPIANVDADALTQAVLNLLSNAVKFSGDARVIELELEPERDEALIRVRDHGRGIEPRLHPLVFDRFFRADDVRADGIPGTGLGLALVDHVARAHGGRVEVDSAVGEGSTFTIRIPVNGRTSTDHGLVEPVELDS